MIERIDKRVTKLFDGLTVISVVAVLVVTVVCVVDVTGSKLFMKPFAPAYSMTQLLSVPLVFCAVGSVQMGRGMMRIDLIANKFPMIVQRALNICGAAFGIALCVFLAWRTYIYTTATLYANHVKTTGDVNLSMWPFGFLLVFGLATLAVSYVFTVLRNVLQYDVLPDLPPDEILAAEEAGLAAGMKGGAAQ